MNNLEGVSTWDLVQELMRRRYRGVDFRNIKAGEPYTVAVNDRIILHGIGPAFLFEITDLPVWMLRLPTGEKSDSKEVMV